MEISAGLKSGQVDTNMSISEVGAQDPNGGEAADTADTVIFDAERMGGDLAVSQSAPFPSDRVRRFGRPISFIWKDFTAEKEPWKLRQSRCLHCAKIVSYHKKSEYVLVHLNRCAPFLKFCKE